MNEADGYGKDNDSEGKDTDYINIYTYIYCTIYDTHLQTLHSP
jgi:hypothetical protein